MIDDDQELKLSSTPLCRHCGKPVKWSFGQGSWVHSNRRIRCRDKRDKMLPTTAQLTVWMESE